jgi:phosphatidylglycerophosphate synthase
VSDVPDRRPIAQRSARWAQALAQALARTAITPNQISIASMAFAAIAGAAFWRAGSSDGAARAAWLLAAAAGCQARLLCNLLDGMVAVEGGKADKDGGFWNEAPDRVSDILILVGAGYGAAASGLVGPELGWAAAAFAVATAYVRALGRNLEQPADFSGPMAKPHRMAAMTVGAVVGAFEPFWGWRGETLVLALAIVAAGAALTALLRAARLIQALKAR